MTGFTFDAKAALDTALKCRTRLNLPNCPIRGASEGAGLGVTSRVIIWSLLEQLRPLALPALEGVDGRSAFQDRLRQLAVVEPDVAQNGLFEKRPYNQTGCDSRGGAGRCLWGKGAEGGGRGRSRLGIVSFVRVGTGRLWAQAGRKRAPWATSLPARFGAVGGQNMRDRPVLPWLGPA